MKNVSGEDFVKAWQTCGSLSEVAAKLGMKEVSASVRAAHYRKRGIPLRRFTDQQGVPVDVKSLTALAKKLAPKNGTP